MNYEDPVHAHKKANKRREEKELHGSLATALTRLLFLKSFSWSQGLVDQEVKDRQTERDCATPIHKRIFFSSGLSGFP
jgi:hypothetical protein